LFVYLLGIQDDGTYGVETAAFDRLLADQHIDHAYQVFPGNHNWSFWIAHLDDAFRAIGAHLMQPALGPGREAGSHDAQAGGLTLNQTDGPIFADDFENGSLDSWTEASGLLIQTTVTHAGTSAAEAAASDQPAFARTALGGEYDDLYAS